MAKKKPIFLSGGNLEVVDGTTDTLDESLIQMATASVDGLMDSSDKAKLDNLPAQSFSLLADGAVGTGKAVYITVAGKAKLATNTAAGTKAEAISLTSAASGDSVTLAGPNYGITSLGSGLTVGAAVYLGTTGGVTSAVPSADGSIVQRIGTAKASNSVLLDIESMVVIN